MPAEKGKILYLKRTLVLTELLFLLALVVPCYADSDLLTQEEREWLQQHGPIKYAPDPDFFPFEFIGRDQEAHGITPDILNLITHKLGIKFVTIRYQTWSDVIEGIKRGDVDLLGTLTRTEERETYLKFTSPYLNAPVGLFVHKKNPQYSNINNLKGKKVGVVKNYGAEYWLRKNHPELELITTTTTLEGLWMLESGELDAFVEVIPVGVSVAIQNSLFSIRHSTTPLYTTLQHFAVIKTNEILHSIIEKGISLVSESEKYEILKRWAKEMPVEQTYFLKIISILFGIIAVLIIISLAIFYSLRKIIRERTEALRRSENFFRSIFQNNPLPTVTIELETGKILEVNEKLLETTGYTEEEVKGKTTLELGAWIKPENRTELVRILKEKRIVRGFEQQLRFKGGKILDTIIHGQVFEVNGKEIILYLIEDVTEKKKLESSQKRLADIVKSSDAYVLTTDVNLHVLYLNPSAQNHLNISKNENISEILPDDERKRLTDKIIPVAVRDGLWKGKQQIKVKNGELIPVLTTAIAHKKPDDTVDHYSFIFRDITELTNTYEALKQSEERLRQIIENTAQVFYVHDPDRVITFITPQVKTLLGFEPSELIGRFTYELLSDNPINKIASELTEIAIRTGERQRPHEAELVAKEGRKVWVEIHESPIVQHKKTIAIIGSFTDITRRKEAELLLKERQSLLDSIYKNSPDNIAIFDILSGKLIYANKELAELLGYQGSKITDFTQFSKLLHEKDIEKVKQHFFKIRNGDDGVIYEVEYRLKNVSGDYTWFHARDSIFKRDENGNVIQILSVQRDITKEKKLEQAKREAEEQKYQANKMQALGELASGVAHDINNQLTTIINNLAMLTFNKNFSKEDAVYLKYTEAAIENIRNLSKQLLVFSRKEAMDIKPADINEIITDTLKILKRSIPENIEIKSNLAPNLPLINADKAMIQTTLINLATNARDAMVKGGIITISTQLVSFSKESDIKDPNAKKGQYIMIKFSDTGTGIPKEIIKRIFDPFFTTKPVGKGTGMGLSIVHGIVTNHGGWVDVESEIGKGTSFMLYFPVPEKPVTAPLISDFQSANYLTSQLPRGNETILLVEDDDLARETVGLLTRMLGYNVLLASDGASALKIIENYNDKIDLLFTDIVMPGGLNGIALYEKVKERLPDIKVLFTSGHSGESIIVADLVAEGIFLPKPFDAFVLSKKLRECLDKNHK